MTRPFDISKHRKMMIICLVFSIISTIIIVVFSIHEIQIGKTFDQTVATVLGLIAFVSLLAFGLVSMFLLPFGDKKSSIKEFFPDNQKEHEEKEEEEE